MEKFETGIFTISLDFELYWGVRDSRSIENYKDNLNNTKHAIEKILELFEKYKIHATWASVGFLFLNNENIKKYIPKKIPNYANENLNPYKYINNNNFLEERFHFALETLKNISKEEYQEIATHTFSHYYCIEEGQTKEDFDIDLQQAINVSKKFLNQEIYSLVFPRNQWNRDYLEILKKNDILCYRGNEKSWIYKVENSKKSIKLIKRAMKLVDTYIGITGSNTYSMKDLLYLKDIGLYNIPSSRFLRPVSKKLFFLEKLKINRIKKSLTYGAKKNKLFHLWWHPHNFGQNMDINLLFLEEILMHFSTLQKLYNMRSLNMQEVAFLLKNKGGV